MKFINALIIGLCLLMNPVYATETTGQFPDSVSYNGYNISFEHPKAADCQVLCDGLTRYEKENLTQYGHSLIRYVSNISENSKVEIIGRDAFVKVGATEDMNLVEKIESELVLKGASRVFIEQTDNISDDLLLQKGYKVLDKELRCQNQDGQAEIKDEINQDKIDINDYDNCANPVERTESEPEFALNEEAFSDFVGQTDNISDDLLLQKGHEVLDKELIYQDQEGQSEININDYNSSFFPVIASKDLRPEEKSVAANSLIWQTIDPKLKNEDIATETIEQQNEENGVQDSDMTDNDFAIFVRDERQQIHGGLWAEKCKGLLGEKYMDGNNTLFIYTNKFFMDSSLRGQGFGKCLMRLLDNYAKSLGIKILELGTTNPLAYGLYENLGYQPYLILTNLPNVDSTEQKLISGYTMRKKLV